MSNILDLDLFYHSMSKQPRIGHNCYLVHYSIILEFQKCANLSLFFLDIGCHYDTYNLEILINKIEKKKIINTHFIEKLIMPERVNFNPKDIKYILQNSLSPLIVKVNPYILSRKYQAYSSDDTDDTYTYLICLGLASKNKIRVVDFFLGYKGFMDADLICEAITYNIEPPTIITYKRVKEKMEGVNFNDLLTGLLYNKMEKYANNLDVVGGNKFYYGVQAIEKLEQEIELILTYIEQETNKSLDLFVKLFMMYWVNERESIKNYLNLNTLSNLNDSFVKKIVSQLDESYLFMRKVCFYIIKKQMSGSSTKDIIAHVRSLLKKLVDIEYILKEAITEELNNNPNIIYYKNKVEIFNN